MKAIIDGKRYDTATAIKLASASSNVGRSDFGYWSDELYQTPRSKVFFLAGEGHARSHYAKNLGGGSWGAGEKITPMTRAEAMAWAERNLSADEVEEIFAEDIQDA